jgi:hypothetical protein
MAAFPLSNRADEWQELAGQRLSRTYCRALPGLGLSCDIAQQQLSNPVGRLLCIG